MHALIPVLNIYAPVALLIAMLGITYKVGQHVVRISRPRYPGMATNLLDAPPKLPWLSAIWNVLSFPVTRFNVRANPILVTGVIFYHIGIITIAASYALSVLLLAWYVALGYPVPDISTGATVSQNLSYSNIFAIIFGCGEPLQSEFLFGPLAGPFRAVTWMLVGSAVFGNTMILLTHLLGRGGAILHDLDNAAQGVRRKGVFKPSHLLVTFMVYSVIWTEILSRLEVVPGIVYLHSMLGATLILILPFSYLFHMVYFPVSVFYAARRWRERYVA
jgi:nitrate reductase gamma subunit